MVSSMKTKKLNLHRTSSGRMSDASKKRVIGVSVSEALREDARVICLGCFHRPLQSYDNMEQSESKSHTPIISLHLLLIGENASVLMRLLRKPLGVLVPVALSEDATLMGAQWPVASSCGAVGIHAPHTFIIPLYRPPCKWLLCFF
jgi:hypothetical protein